jgi:hypothetical protein
MAAVLPDQVIETGSIDGEPRSSAGKCRFIADYPVFGESLCVSSYLYFQFGFH